MTDYVPLTDKDRSIHKLVTDQWEDGIVETEADYPVPLTDEELAKLYTKYSVAYGRETLLCGLIADLRATRAEVQELITQANAYAQEAIQLRAEVERLRRELDRANRSGGLYAGRIDL